MSEARVQLLQALKCVSEVCDSQLLMASPSSSSLSPKAASLVCKGLMVASFNAFESFVERRWAELLDGSKSSLASFQDLPDETQTRMLQNVVAVLGRYHFDLEALDDFKGRLIEVGDFFANVNKTAGSVHPFVGRWKGSNISASELAKGLSCFHVYQPWKSMQAIYDVVLGASGTSTGTNLQMVFRGAVEDRHAAAHEMRTSITRLSLSEVPRNLRDVAFCFDVLASSAVYLMHCADRGFLRERQYVKPSVIGRYWEVRERKKGFAAYVRSDPFSSPVCQVASRRANKVEGDHDELVQWVRRQRKGIEFIVDLSPTGSLVDWETCV